MAGTSVAFQDLLLLQLVENKINPKGWSNCDFFHLRTEQRTLSRRAVNRKSRVCLARERKSWVSDAAKFRTSHCVKWFFSFNLIHSKLIGLRDSQGRSYLNKSEFWTGQNFRISVHHPRSTMLNIYKSSSFATSSIVSRTFKTIIRSFNLSIFGEIFLKK